MRPITKSRFTPTSYTYTPYGDAKGELIEALGNYCSYCERRGYSSALDVEHIRSRHTHPEREFLWRNFILGCKNCNPIKGTTSILNMYFPTVHNTYNIFHYDELGYVSVNTVILATQEERNKAQRLIDLVGLDRRPGHPNYSKKDTRWSERQDVYMLAKKYFPKYQSGDLDADSLVDLAKAHGFWSVWMTVFSGETEFTDRLTQAFPGTQSL